MITPPSGDPRDILPFNLFVAEEEGILPTRRGLINRISKVIQEQQIPEIEWSKICNDFGLNFNSFSFEEKEYLKEKLNGRNCDTFNTNI